MDRRQFLRDAGFAGLALGGALRAGSSLLAQTAINHPGRFGFFAAVPLADTDGSLREIEYAFDTLDADGVSMNASAAKMWPGDPSQMPVFEELNRRKTTVFLHPNTTPFCCINPPGVRAAVAEFDNDVNRAVLSLLWNGVLTNYPHINFIVAHTGGTVPVLAGRIQDRVPKDRPDLYPYGALDKLRRLYPDDLYAMERGNAEGLFPKWRLEANV